MTAQEVILSYSSVKRCGLGIYLIYLLFMFCLEGGEGEEEDEHGMKKMKLTGYWGEGYGHL